MPLYDFRCADCQKEFAVAMPVAEYEHGSFACPDCHGRNVERVYQHVEVVTSKKS